jgi:hypothetical protein
MSSKYECFKRNSVVNPKYAEGYDRIFSNKPKSKPDKKTIEEEKRQRKHQKKQAKHQAKKDRKDEQRAEAKRQWLEDKADQAVKNVKESMGISV